MDWLTITCTGPKDRPHPEEVVGRLPYETVVGANRVWWLWNPLHTQGIFADDDTLITPDDWRSVDRWESSMRDRWVFPCQIADCREDLQLTRKQMDALAHKVIGMHAHGVSRVSISGLRYALAL